MDSHQMPVNTPFVLSFTRKGYMKHLVANLSIWTPGPVRDAEAV